MKAMILESVCDLEHCQEPLRMVDLPMPVPSDHEVLIKILACGVCHTELDEIEGRTMPSVFPVIPGHQVVGIVVSTGKLVTSLNPCDRVGVAWIYSSCGKCDYCLEGYENLCKDFVATGRDTHGGYAQYITVPESSACLIPGVFTDTQAAPLLCAGAVGYRSLMLTGVRDGDNVGLTGYGASAHIVHQLIKFLYPASSVFVFARSDSDRNFASQQGATWTGDTSDVPPGKMKAIIDTTPAWKPVVEALKNLAPGGRLVINAIRKENKDKEYLLGLDYSSHLWMEKEIKSVANVTRKDVSDFLKIAAEIPVDPVIQKYTLEEANVALTDLKHGNIPGAKVLVME